MRASELSAIARWPNVPACYGWLSLDRRGSWRLQGEPVLHAGFIEFLNQRYGADEAGNWFVQNGPQKVYVALEYTPLVLRLSPDGALDLHTGERGGDARGVYLDEEGNVLVQLDAGIALLDDRDLQSFLSMCRDARGEPASEALLEALALGGEGAHDVFWRGMPIQRIARSEIPARFGFRPAPAP